MKRKFISIYIILFFATVGCEEATDIGGLVGNTGVGGSFAQFTIAKDHLYVVDAHNLRAYNIANSEKLTRTFDQYIGSGIETIFPYQDYLFIGSETGMQIFDISRPSKPKYLSRYVHIQGCDPVVVQGSYAYVTIRDGRTCGGGNANQLDVLDITDLTNPELIGSYDMFNPHGLGIDQGQLFVCEGSNGLKTFDASNPRDLQIMEHLTGFFGYDVIPLNDLLILIGKDGLYQFDYTSPGQLEYLSAIAYQ